MNKLCLYLILPIAFVLAGCADNIQRRRLRRGADGAGPAEFATNVRPRSTDPTLVQQNRIEASDSATVRAANTSNGYAGKNTPFAADTSNRHTRKIASFAAIAKRTVPVEVTGVVRPSHNSFELRWIDRNTGFPGIVVRRPHGAGTPRGNPLEIQVHDLNRSRDL